MGDGRLIDLRQSVKMKANHPGAVRIDSELGIATHYVPQKALAGLVDEIKNLSDPTLPRLAALITKHSAPAPPHPRQLPEDPAEYSSKANPEAISPLCGSVRKLLDQAFSQPTVSKIYKVLREAIADEQGATWDKRARRWAEGVVKVMDTRSPTGLKIALGNYRQAKKDQDLKTQLNRDLAMTTAFLVSPSRVRFVSTKRLNPNPTRRSHLRPATWSTVSSTN